LVYKIKNKEKHKYWKDRYKHWNKILLNNSLFSVIYLSKSNFLCKNHHKIRFFVHDRYKWWLCLLAWKL
jgi:hypothetical protein